MTDGGSSDDVGIQSTESRASAQNVGAGAEPSRRRGAIVLGMHRGGTSALAGLLAGAGFHLGADDAMQADPNNAVGYFELISTMETNDKLLAAAGGRWDRPPTWDAVAAVRDLARAAIDPAIDRLSAAAGPAPLVVKDPRISVLLPAWSHLIGDALVPLVTVRNPLASAYSLAKRSGLALSAGLALWEMTWAGLLRALHGKLVYVVGYERALADPSTSDALLSWLAEQLPEYAVAPTSAAPMRSDLHHNRVHYDELVEHATSAQLAMWKWIGEVPDGPVRLDAPEALMTPSPGALVTLRLDAESRDKYAELHDLAVQLDQRRQAADEAIHELAGQVEVLTGRVGELTGERARLRNVIAGHERVIDGLQADLLQLDQACGAANALAADLDARLAKVGEELSSVYASEAWRIGHAVVRPAAWLAHRVRTGPGGSPR